MKDAEFWLHRGFVLSSANKYIQSIDCYIQGLRINKHHVALWFNLGACYLKTQQLSKSIYCFQYVLKLKNDFTEASYGLSICLLKKKQYSEALEILQQISDPSEKSKAQLLYIKAMCNKELGNNKEAIAIYSEFISKNVNNGNKKSLNFILQFLLCPFYTTKKAAIDFLSLFDNFLLEYEEQVNKYILYPSYDKEWKTADIPYILNELPKLRFFCRFNNYQLVQILKLTSIIIIPLGEVFIVPKDKVYVIVQGSIIVKSYKSDLDNPEILAKLSSGDVIGYSCDNEFSRDSENWLHPITNLEIAVYKMEDFNFIWSEQKSIKANIEVGKLSQNILFNDVSELTLFKLYEELLHIATYENGSVLCQQSKRSLLNIKSKALYTGIISSSLIILHNEKQTKPELEFIDYVKKHAQANLSITKMAKEISCTESDGIHIIMEGKCDIVNPIDGYVISHLSYGDVFGECTSLKVIGYNYFGDIIANGPVTTAKIMYDDLKQIPIHELSRISANCKKRENINKLISICCRKYGKNQLEFVY